MGVKILDSGKSRLIMTFGNRGVWALGVMVVIHIMT